MKDDEKKVAIITGGGRGIGRAISMELARCGFYAVINYKSGLDEAQKTLEQIRESGGDGEISCFDVTKKEESEAIITEICERFSNVEVLVNNAGIIADGLFVMMPERDWNSVIDVTLKGFYNVTKPVVGHMIRNRKGAVVSISSASALMGNRGQANYAAAKAGLIGASKSLAAEVARLGVRVNVVAPGLIETEMAHKAPKEKIKELIPMARIGSPGEVAKVVGFLCGEDSSYIAGQVISVNGGMF